MTVKVNNLLEPSYCHTKDGDLVEGFWSTNLRTSPVVHRAVIKKDKNTGQKKAIGVSGDQIHAIKAAKAAKATEKYKDKTSAAVESLSHSLQENYKTANDEVDKDHILAESYMGRGELTHGQKKANSAVKSLSNSLQENYRDMEQYDEDDEDDMMSSSMKSMEQYDDEDDDMMMSSSMKSMEQYDDEDDEDVVIDEKHGAVR